jgi:hypothetical protein
MGDKSDHGVVGQFEPLLVFYKAGGEPLRSRGGSPAHAAPGPPHYRAFYPAPAPWATLHAGPALRHAALMPTPQNGQSHFAGTPAGFDRRRGVRGGGDSSPPRRSAALHQPREGTRRGWERTRGHWRRASGAAPERRLAGGNHSAGREAQDRRTDVAVSGSDRSDP